MGPAPMRPWLCTTIPKLPYMQSNYIHPFPSHVIIYIFLRDKLHGLEYPVGERIIVKVNGMSSARMDTSFIDSKNQESRTLI